MLKLIIEDDEGRKTVVPFAREEITIGRQEGNTIRLTERNVSRRHARLLRQNGHVLIEDLGSSNGIKINGDRIQGQVKINDGDLVQIGDYDLAIQRDEDKQAAAAAAAAVAAMPTVPLDSAKTQSMLRPPDGATVPLTPALEAPAASDEDVQEAPAPEEPTQGDDSEGEVDDGKALGAEKHQATSVIRIDQIQGNRPHKVVDLKPGDQAKLVVMNSDFVGKEFPCVRSEMKIGRVEENDIALDHRSLSRTHCKVVREDSGDWRVVDMQSANGLMVNGESYAQVTLRSGDVIELGHVKLKFLMPGDTYTPPVGGATSVQVGSDRDEEPTAQRPSAGGANKTPLIAVAAGFLLLLVLGGGYLIFRSTPETPTKPPKKDPGSEPVRVRPNDVKPPPDVEPTPVKPPPDVPPPADPEAGKKAAEKTLAQAKEAITGGDFDQAELLLRGCKIGESPCPEAKQMLAQLEGEQGYRRALKDAEAALNADDLEKARVQLEASRGTKLLKERHAALEARRAEAVKQKIADAAKKPVEVPKPPPVEVKPPDPKPVAAKAGNSPEVQKLLDEAKELSKEKQFQAVINRMEKCAKIDSSNAECYLKRGTAHGNLKEPELVVKYYKLYLQYAKPDDPMVPKVQQRVKEYEESLKK